MTERAQHIETLKQFRLVFSEGHGFSRAEVAAFDYAIAALLTEEQEVTRLKILVGKLGLQLDASEQRIAHARKQWEANGFQQGWHAALQRMRDGDKIHDLLELVPKFNAATALLTEATTPDTGRLVLGIRCQTCQRVSYHPQDVEQRYCGWCHRFHDDRNS